MLTPWFSNWGSGWWFLITEMSTHWFSFHFFWFSPSFIWEGDLTSLLLLGQRYQLFPTFMIQYIYKDNLCSYFFEYLLFSFSWLCSFLCGPWSWLFFPFFFDFLSLLDFEIFGPVGWYVIFLRREFFLQYLGIELEKHGQEVIMRSEHLFPNFYCLQNLSVNHGVQFLIHEQSGYFQQKLLGRNLWVKREFDIEREVFKKIETIEENFLVLDAESFGDSIEGMFGPE